MATEPDPSTPPAPAPAVAASTGKTKKRSYNPIRWFLGLSMRVQLLLLIAVVIVVMVYGRRKPAPTPPPPPTVTEPPAPGASSGTGTVPPKPSERFSPAAPTADEMSKIANTKTKGMEGGTDKLDRGIPDAILGEMVTPPKGEDLSDAPSGRATAAGAPYAPRGKRPTSTEVMGVFAAPYRADDRKAASRAAANTNTAATSTGTASAPTAPAELRVYAPYGRLVKCKLYNTLDSLVPSKCPIIAIVMENVEQDGHVIIPALTEVFGYVDGKPKIDANGVGRLYDTGEWTLVLPKQPGGRNGREWVIKGMAMDRRETLLNDKGEVRSWTLDDAAPGMIGYTISTLDNEAVKAFAAQFFSDAARAAAAIGQTQQPSPGMSGAFGATQASPTAANAGIAALGAGTSGSLETVANRIKEELKDRGFYVRVPSGKEFYVFVEQTLDPQQARVGLRRDGSAK